MIFGRKSEPKDPIVGADIGADTTYLGGIAPNGSDSITIRGADDSEPVIPTRAVALGEDSAVGHHSEELFEKGAPTINIMGPFKFGREKYEEYVTPLDEDLKDPLRRQFFDYLYERVDESVKNWDDRIAIPARPGRLNEGQNLLEDYLAEAGFHVECRVNSSIATAIGYWENDRFVDPHFELDWHEGGVILSVDMGAQFLDASVLSIQGHTYRSLSSYELRSDQSQTETYAQYKAEKNGIDISQTAETAPQRFGLLNAINRHFPDLLTNERQMVTITVPSEFGAEDGTQVTLTASEAEEVARAYLETYREVVETAIEQAGLESLEDIDLVITGGMTSRWIPVLQWWKGQGAAWGQITNPEYTIDPDSTVRITSGIAGKLLAAKGASAIGNTEAGHWKRDIEIL